MTEKRLSQYFTVLEPNHARTADYVGFTIKGIRFLFEKAGLPLAGLIPLVEILDRIMKAFPHAAVKAVLETVRQERAMQSLQVDFAAAA